MGSGYEVQENCINWEKRVRKDMENTKALIENYTLILNSLNCYMDSLDKELENISAILKNSNYDNLSHDQLMDLLRKVDNPEAIKQIQARIHKVK